MIKKQYLLYYRLQRNYKETYECDSVFSESSEDILNSETPNVELNEGNTYSSEE
jgi:hypothetical protein